MREWRRAPSIPESAVHPGRRQRGRCRKNCHIFRPNRHIFRSRCRPRRDYDAGRSRSQNTSSTNFKTFNHALGETTTTFCAEKKLAAKLKRGFTRSLHDAPALLPAENTTLRRALENWFRDHHIAPRVVAEFEDLALMKVMAAEGRGFIAVPTVALKDAVAHYAFQIIGDAAKCRLQFHAITAERRIAPPAVALITRKSLP